MLLKLIRKWLKKRLGIVLSIIPEYFMEATRDGTLLAKILLHYNVIGTEELYMIEETKDPAVAFDNYSTYLVHWLKRINFDLSEDDIQEITFGSASAAASVFYELYMKLENKKGRIYGMKLNTHNFQIEKVKDDSKMADLVFEVNPLCEPLIKQWDVINWEKDHLASIVAQCNRSKETYHEYLEEKKAKIFLTSTKHHMEIKEKFLHYEPTNYTYDELILQQQEALAMKPFEPDKAEAKRIMKRIKEKNKQKAEKTAFRIELQHELLAAVWKKIAETEEEEFDKVVCEKLLKESSHEREIAEKLLQIRKQKETIIANRKVQDELDKKKRDKEFIRRLFEEELEERMKFHEKRMAVLAEHQRLYEEKLRIKKLKHEKVCKDAAMDITDLAIQTAEYREQYGVDPDGYIKRTWTTLFIKQEPIFDLLTSSQELREIPHEGTTEEFEEIYKRELKRQDILDEQSFLDYVNFENIWMIEESLEEEVAPMKLGMNCLGYAVHRVLFKKYPVPVPEKSNLPPTVEISVCTILSDISKLDYLKRLVGCRNIKVLQIEDARDFCIQAYETELKTEFDDPFPEEEYLKEMMPTKVASDKGTKKGKGDKKGKGNKKGKGGKKKEKGSKKDKKEGSKKGKKDKKGKSETGEPKVVETVFEDKQAQTPQLFPWEKIIFSNKAKLGRKAKQMLGQGDSLDDKLLVDMFVEYLMSMPDIQGWVLLNYPNNYEQAALLEEALSGKVVPKIYYDQFLNKESLTSIVIEEQSTVDTVVTEEDFKSSSFNDENKVVADVPGKAEETVIAGSVNKTEKRATLPDTEKKRRTISKTSYFSGITILDDWNTTPEERVAKLLPDLKQLAYSSEEDENESDVKEKGATCTCICKQLAKKQEGDEQLKTAEDIPCDDEPTIEQHIPDPNKEPHIEQPCSFHQEKPKTEQHCHYSDESREEQHYQGSEEQKKEHHCHDSEKQKKERHCHDSEKQKKKQHYHESEERKTEHHHYEAKKESLCHYSEEQKNKQECPLIIQHQDEKSEVEDKISVTEAEIKDIQESELELKPECECFLDNIKIQEVEKQEILTQTDILALQQELEAAGDEPIERLAVEDVFAEKRLSNVVPNPRPLEEEEYKSVLTAFIKVVPKKSDEEEEYSIPTYQKFEKTEGVDKFYCDQGCYYLLEYQELNADTIKCLSKMIIGDYSLPPKTSVEIFGEKYKEAMLEVGDHKVTKTSKIQKDTKKKKGKKDKGKMKKGSETAQGKKSKGKSEKSSKAKGKKDKSDKSSKSKGKKDKKGKKGKGTPRDKSKEEIAVTYEDKEVQFPMEEEEEEEEFYQPKAGEPDWEYINLPIPENIELLLADLWDEFETNYKKSFKELFFNKRVILNDIAPFLEKTRQTMREFMAGPDEKSRYLKQFQKTLNELDLELRSDEETKTELICTINDFKEKLLDICDKKMRASEEERRNFIKQNWLYRQFCELTRNSAIAFQLEIDRLVETLQFLSDYYTALITKSIKEGYDFHKEILPKHECDEKNGDEFNQLFINMADEHHAETAFHKHIEETKNMALAFVESLKPLAMKPFATMKNLLSASEKEKKPPKSKKAKGQLKKFEPDEDVKENTERIFEEWECAINGEFARMNLQLNSIKNEAFNRLNDVIAWIKKVFRLIFDDISKRYESEIRCVHRACELLMNSVEQELIIQPELTFEDDQLAQIEITLFPDTLNIPEEDYTQGSFKLEQLEKIVRILIDLAPSGFIMKTTFLLIIQDMLYQENYEEETDTPKLWRNMSMTALNALMKRLFEDEKYLYWKDFIVCNLMIPFPTRPQLMAVRKQFRDFDIYATERVSREEFEAVTFWFDDDEKADRLKSILLKMYQTGKDGFNYTAMLLDFCKDTDQMLGFVKALEVSLGKYICYDEQLGKSFVDEVLENRMLFEQQKKDHEEIIVLAEKTVSLLIDKIIAKCEDEEFSLTEVEEAQISSTNLKEKDTSWHAQPEDRFIADVRFSDGKIGFESRDNTELCYFLPLELVLIIVSTELTWNSKVDDPPSPSFKDRIVEIYEECRNDKFKDIVLSHEFLNNEKLKELFSTTNKFLAHNPVRLVKTIVQDALPSLDDTEEFVPNLEFLE